MLLRNTLYHDLAGAVLLVSLHHLRKVTREAFIVDNHVGQHHREVFVPHHVCGTAHSMAQAFRARLAHGDDLNSLWKRVLYCIKQSLFILQREHLFKLVVSIKVVFYSLFARPCYQHNLTEAGAHRLFNDVLNNRFINHWQHLFWNRLGGGEYACTEAGNRDNHFG